jgi:hypothetical protein
VTPVNPSDWTQHEVLDVDGKVTVHSLKSDVYIDAQSKNPKDVKKASRSTCDLVRESEQKSGEEKCGVAYVKADRIPVLGATLNSVPARIAGAAAIAGVTCYVLCRGDDPVSSWKP